MLKYVPTSDEANLFNTHLADLDLFARADRYLFEMSKWVNFRKISFLKTLFKKNYFWLYYPLLQ